MHHTGWAMEFCSEELRMGHQNFGENIIPPTTLAVTLWARSLRHNVVLPLVKDWKRNRFDLYKREYRWLHYVLVIKTVKKIFLFFLFIFWDLPFGFVINFKVLWKKKKKMGKAPWVWENIYKKNHKLRQQKFKYAFEYAGAKDWNSLPINIREITSINIFKQTLFTYLLDCDVNSHNRSLIV